MNTRELKGKEIATRLKIQRQGNKWVVPSQTGKGKYTVDIDGEVPHCTCPDFELRSMKCKHIYAVEYTIKTETTTRPKQRPSPKRRASPTNRIGLPTMPHKQMRKPTFSPCSMISVS